MVPYDDCPPLPVPEDDLTATNASSPPLMLSSSSSSALTSSADNLGRGSSSSSAALTAGAVADGGGIIRGGDVVRLCHLTSKGFLTHESVLPPARRKTGGLGVVGRGDGVGEGEGVAKKEVRQVELCLTWCLWLVC